MIEPFPLWAFFHGLRDDEFRSLLTAFGLLPLAEAPATLVEERAGKVIVRTELRWRDEDDHKIAIREFLDGLGLTASERSLIFVYLKENLYLLPPSSDREYRICHQLTNVAESSSIPPWHRRVIGAAISRDDWADIFFALYRNEPYLDPHIDMRDGLIARLATALLRRRAIAQTYLGLSGGEEVAETPPALSEMIEYLERYVNSASG